MSEADEVSVGRDAVAILLAMRRGDNSALAELVELYDPAANPGGWALLLGAVAAVFFDIADRYRRPEDFTIEQALESHKWFLAEEGS